MKTRTSAVFWVCLWLAVISFGASAGEPTAFDLIKEGNRHVGEDARDRIVQIRSEKSVGTLEPVIWFVVFYDPDATFKATEVKFAAGKKVDVKRPTRVLEPVTGGQKQLDREKIKVDSDKALEIASEQPILKNLKLTSSRLVLERGHDDLPVWKVTLWAQKLRKPSEEAKLGEVILSAEDGKVLKNDIKINRVD